MTVLFVNHNNEELPMLMSRWFNGAVIGSLVVMSYAHAESGPVVPDVLTRKVEREQSQLLVRTVELQRTYKDAETGSLLVKGVKFFAQLAQLLIAEVPQLMSADRKSPLDKTLVLEGLVLRAEEAQADYEKKQSLEGVMTFVGFALKLFTLCSTSGVSGIVDVSLMGMQMLTVVKNALEQQDHETLAEAAPVIGALSFELNGQLPDHEQMTYCVTDAYGKLQEKGMISEIDQVEEQDQQEIEESRR